MLLYTGWLEKSECALLAQLDRVTGYEPVGQGFESLQARQYMVGLVQLVRAPVCGTGGHRFESDIPPHFFE